MNEEVKKFAGVKVGDKVYSAVIGRGVVEVVATDSFLIKTHRGSYRCTIDGKLTNGTDVHWFAKPEADNG